MEKIELAEWPLEEPPGEFGPPPGPSGCTRIWPTERNSICAYGSFLRLERSTGEILQEHHTEKGKSTDAILTAMAKHVTQYGFPNHPFPKTVYRTPNPEYGISEAYELRTPGPKWLKRAGHFSRQR